MDKLLTILAENYGILGLMLAIAIGFNVFQYKVNQALQESRIKDLKESHALVSSPMKAIQQTVNLILNLIQSGIKK